jgi:hypothetical protein
MVTDDIKRIIPIDNNAFTIDNSRYLLQILSCLKLAVPHFKSACNSSNNKKHFNEDELTQSFYQQVIILTADFPFSIGCQYRDWTEKSKGISDLYFWLKKSDALNDSIFSIECKRLPAPTKKREKEYVIGNNNNGGIERFKTEKHGKGLKKCGMIGFVEKETFDYWLQTVNTWIVDLSNSSGMWSTDEKLTDIEGNVDYSCLKSIAHRYSQAADVELYHLWIHLT